MSKRFLKVSYWQFICLHNAYGSYLCNEVLGIPQKNCINVETVHKGNRVTEIHHINGRKDIIGIMSKINGTYDYYFTAKVLKMPIYAGIKICDYTICGERCITVNRLINLDRYVGGQWEQLEGIIPPQTYNLVEMV